MTPDQSRRSLAGVSIRCHCGPDSLPRVIDAFDIARIGKKRGMRGIVLKNHYEPTAPLAALTRKALLVMIAPIHLGIADMQEAAASGAWIEFVYNGLIGPYREFEIADYANAIRCVGSDHRVLASDLGQPVTPPHPGGLADFFDGLEAEGFTASEMK